MITKHSTKTIRDYKKTKTAKTLHMLTCYDFPTAQMLNETELDLILVGDSLANVVLGYESTIPVGLFEMILFSKAVRKGAPEKFIIGDMPFGTYSTITEGIKNATRYFKEAGVDAIKLEGAYPYQLKMIERLTQTGVPVMGHIGLKPQSVYQAGGYFIYGKTAEEKKTLMEEAKNLEKAGAFCIVLECVEESLTNEITKAVSIPTIGIGSGTFADGQVLVINDLLKIGKHKVPKFCQPVADLYQLKKEKISQYLKSIQ